MNAARPHTDGTHTEGDTTRISAKATEQTPTESFVVTDHGLSSIPPIPETPQTFASKLRAIGYREPVTTKPDDEGLRRFLAAQDNYVNERNKKKAREAFWPAVVFIVLLVGFLCFGAWTLGQLLRGEQ